MEGHHRALAEADQRQRVAAEPMPPHLGVEKPLKPGRGGIDAAPALLRIADGEPEPLPPGRRFGAGLGRVRGDECRLRQQRLPRAADLDQIVAVGAIAVQEYDELPRGTLRTRSQPRTVERSGHANLRQLVGWKRQSWYESTDSIEIAAFQVLMCGSSCRTTFNNELWTSRWPL